MCLDSISYDAPEKGIAYKVVRVNEDGSYSPEWPYFFTNGDGGSATSFKKDSREKLPTKTVYRIGKPYRVRHTRIVYISHRSRYLAGVHLYASWFEAKRQMPSNGAFSTDWKYTILECRYSGRICNDKYVIVAERIVPLREVVSEKED